MSQFSEDRGAELRELFFETSQELLDALNDDALKLEKSPDDREIVRSIRRRVHTLKGDAAACGFRELSELAHRLEDALALDVAPSAISLAELGLTAADVFAAVLAAYRNQTALPSTTRLDDMVRHLAVGIPSSGCASPGPASPAPAVPAQLAVWTESEHRAVAAAQAGGKKAFHVVAEVDPACGMPIAARQLVANALASIAQILGARPEPSSPANSKRLDLLLATAGDKKTLLEKCLIPTVIARAECFPLDAAAMEAAAAAAEKDMPPVAETGDDKRPASAGEEPETATARSTAGENLLRVDAERIDNVLNLVGELILAKSMLQQAMHEFTRQQPKHPLRPRFSDAMAFHSRVLNDLQRSVMKIRMVPVEQLFRRFPRIVRDTAKRCGKQVHLVASGQTTDVDKGLLDAIAEPLTHIVRNAVSHGIESPRERELAKKDAAGKIRLNAYHQANQLIVEISDDGAGIDAAKLRSKALSMNLLTADEAGRMSTEEALELIFRPGFSTAQEITEVSGRGIGLDVVRSVLLRMKGTVELQTEPGRGTRFRLKLPLTLAIIKALLFRIGKRLYAIDLSSVAEIARAQESQLHRVGTTEVLELGEQVLSVVRLGERSSSDFEGDKTKFFVLVLTFGERRLGLIVDALEGEEELVIKALDDQTASTDLVSGASILGDGRVVLIMNVAAVMERFNRRGTLLIDAALLGQAQASGAEARL